MKIAFLERGWEDYRYWQINDRAILKRINRLIEDIARSPDAGIGKPEILKHTGTNARSRRITDEHRLVYAVVDDEIIILQARYHY